MLKSILKAALGLLAVAALAAAPSPATAEPEAATVVIAHPGVKEKALDADAVQRLFLGKKTTWEGGGGVILAVLAEGPLHETFLKAYVGKTASQFTSHWRKLVFTGKASEPRSFATEEELVAFVAATPGAVGYVGGSVEKKGVQQLVVSK